MEKYSPEEIKDIREREQKCLDFLKENHMTPAAIMQKIRIEDDVFVDKVIPYLQDFKYEKNNSTPEVKKSVDA